MNLPPHKWHSAILRPVGSKEKLFEKMLSAHLSFNEEMLSAFVKTADTAASSLRLPWFTSLCQLPVSVTTHGGFHSGWGSRIF